MYDLFSKMQVDRSVRPDEVTFVRCFWDADMEDSWSKERSIFIIL